MKHSKLLADQIAATGYTDVFVLEPADCPPGLASAVILDALGVGDIVYPRTTLEIIKGFTGPTGAPTVSIGITGTAAAYLAASAIGTPATFVPASTIGASAVGAAGNLIATFAVGAGDGAAPTAGEMRIWMDLRRGNERRVTL